MKEFNLNYNVYIQLTHLGKEILERQHKILYAQIGQPIPEYIPPKEDKDGWSKWQLWHLFDRFGAHVHMGGNLPFSTVIKLEGG